MQRKKRGKRGREEWLGLLYLRAPAVQQQRLCRASRLLLLVAGLEQLGTPLLRPEQGRTLGLLRVLRERLLLALHHRPLRPAELLVHRLKVGGDLRHRLHELVVHVPEEDVRLVLQCLAVRAARHALLAVLVALGAHPRVHAREVAVVALVQTVLGRELLVLGRAQRVAADERLLRVEPAGRQTLDQVGDLRHGGEVPVQDGPRQGLVEAVEVLEVQTRGHAVDQLGSLDDEVVAAGVDGHPTVVGVLPLQVDVVDNGQRVLLDVERRAQTAHQVVHARELVGEAAQGHERAARLHHGGLVGDALQQALKLLLLLREGDTRQGQLRVLAVHLLRFLAHLLRELAEDDQGLPRVVLERVPDGAVEQVRQGLQDHVVRAVLVLADVRVAVHGPVDLLLPAHAVDGEERREELGDGRHDVLVGVALLPRELGAHRVLLEQGPAHEGGEDQVLRAHVHLADGVQGPRRKTRQELAAARGRDETLALQVVRGVAPLQAQELLVEVHRHTLVVQLAESLRLAEGEHRLHHALRHVAHTLLVHLHLVPALVRGLEAVQQTHAQHGRGVDRHVALQRRQTRGHQTHNLRLRDSVEQHVSDPVLSTPAGTTRHLTELHRRQTHVVARKHNRPARGVDTEGETVGGDNHLQLLHAEQLLHVVPVLRGQTGVVDTDASLEGADEEVGTVQVVLEVLEETLHVVGLEGVTALAVHEGVVRQDVRDGAVDQLRLVDVVAATAVLAVLTLLRRLVVLRRLERLHLLLLVLHLVRQTLHDVLPLRRLLVRLLRLLELRHDRLRQVLADALVEVEHDGGEQTLAVQAEQQVREVRLDELLRVERVLLLGRDVLSLLAHGVQAAAELLHDLVDHEARDGVRLALVHPAHEPVLQRLLVLPRAHLRDGDVLAEEVLRAQRSVLLHGLDDDLVDLVVGLQLRHLVALLDEHLQLIVLVHHAPDAAVLERVVRLRLEAGRGRLGHVGGLLRDDALEQTPAAEQLRLLELEAVAVVVAPRPDEHAAHLLEGLLHRVVQLERLARHQRQVLRELAQLLEHRARHGREGMERHDVAVAERLRALLGHLDLALRALLHGAGQVDELAQVVPALVPEDALDLVVALLGGLRRLVLLLDQRLRRVQPRLEGVEVANRGGQSEERRTRAHEQTLPQMALSGRVHAVHLVEDDVLHTLRPLLVARREHNVLEHRRDGDEHLRLERTAHGRQRLHVRASTEDAEQRPAALVVLAVLEDGVDVLRGLVTQRTRRRDVHHDVVHGAVHDLLHAVVRDEGLAGGGRRAAENGLPAVDRVKHLPLPRVRAEGDTAVRLARGAVEEVAHLAHLEAHVAAHVLIGRLLPHDAGGLAGAAGQLVLALLVVRDALGLGDLLVDDLAVVLEPEEDQDAAEDLELLVVEERRVHLLLLHGLVVLLALLLLLVLLAVGLRLLRLVRFSLHQVLAHQVVHAAEEGDRDLDALRAQVRVLGDGRPLPLEQLHALDLGADDHVVVLQRLAVAEELLDLVGAVAELVDRHVLLDLEVAEEVRPGTLLLLLLLLLHDDAVLVLDDLGGLRHLLRLALVLVLVLVLLRLHHLVLRLRQEAARHRLGTGLDRVEELHTRVLHPHLHLPLLLLGDVRGVVGVGEDGLHGLEQVVALHALVEVLRLPQLALLQVAALLRQRRADATDLLLRQLVQVDVRHQAVHQVVVRRQQRERRHLLRRRRRRERVLARQDRRRVRGGAGHGGPDAREVGHEGGGAREGAVLQQQHADHLAEHAVVPGVRELAALRVGRLAGLALRRAQVVRRRRGLLRRVLHHGREEGVALREVRALLLHLLGLLHQRLRPVRQRQARQHEQVQQERLREPGLQVGSALGRERLRALQHRGHGGREQAHAERVALEPCGAGGDAGGGAGVGGLGDDGEGVLAALAEERLALGLDAGAVDLLAHGQEALGAGTHDEAVDEVVLRHQTGRVHGVHTLDDAVHHERVQQELHVGHRVRVGALGGEADLLNLLAVVQQDERRHLDGDEALPRRVAPPARELVHDLRQRGAKVADDEVAGEQLGGVAGPDVAVAVEERNGKDAAAARELVEDLLRHVRGVEQLAAALLPVDVPVREGLDDDGLTVHDETLLRGHVVEQVHALRVPPAVGITHKLPAAQDFRVEFAMFRRRRHDDDTVRVSTD
eukprot:Rhum_TRINITY_DN10818_c0_g1::Rhum_TRINITY_DN10818_c0_g1_i1::g.40833::m.40833